jgi:uncharacterized protein YoxC|tara:strand:+ start:522 stop:680 length:159 start_codon:yes stop_codon:yes gene_type:complete
MTVELILSVVLWILVMTLAVLLHKIGRLIDRIEARTNIVRVNIDELLKKMEE